MADTIPVVVVGRFIFRVRCAENGHFPQGDAETTTTPSDVKTMCDPALMVAFSR